MKACFLLAGVLLLASCKAAPPAPLPQMPDGPFMVQDLRDSSFPVKYLPRFSEYQEVAQTFIAPADKLLLVRIALFVTTSAGPAGYLQVYEVDDFNTAPTFGKQLRFNRIDLSETTRGEYHDVEIIPPLPLERNKVYGFLISVDEEDREIGVGLTRTDVVPAGGAWYYSRLIGDNGKVLDQRHAWRMRGDDLTFRITFRADVARMDPKDVRRLVEAHAAAARTPSGR
jgi:hypothetical protein